MVYDGNSQGGIMGGSLAALAPDFDRAVLGVPAMNYSTLLRRSVDFDQYAVVLYQNYPNELERPLILALMQMLWDRGEADGYAHHMTDDPLPNTPAHHVLLGGGAYWGTIVEAGPDRGRLRLDEGRVVDPPVLLALLTATDDATLPLLTFLLSPFVPRLLVCDPNVKHGSLSPASPLRFADRLASR